jgi:hypothetical protein
VFHRFRQAKFANGGSFLSSSQFLKLPQLLQKMMLASKVVKIDPKIIISLLKILIPETVISDVTSKSKQMIIISDQTLINFE